MIIDKYKSIFLCENRNGEFYISPKHSEDVLSKIIPDALDYVQNHEFKFKDGITLKNVNGVDIEIYPNSNLHTLIRYWKEEYYVSSGICLEI